MTIWQLWWVWMVAGFALGVLEVLAPGYIFLGFAVGAIAIGIMLLAGGPLAALLTTSLPLLILIFAVASLVAWYVFRLVFGVRSGQVKIWDRDINDDT